MYKKWGRYQAIEMYFMTKKIIKQALGLRELKKRVKMMRALKLTWEMEV